MPNNGQVVPANLAEQIVWDEGSDISPIAPQEDVTPPTGISAAEFEEPVPEWGVKYPTLYGIAGATREAVGPVIEATGLVGGGILGTPSGPAGTAVGAGLGYAGGKRLTSVMDELLGNLPPATVLEALEATAQDVRKGMEIEMGGQVAGKALGVAGRKASELARQKLPEKLYAGATKFSTTLKPEEAAARVRTGLEEGIKPTVAGLEKLEGLKKQVYSQIDDLIKPGAKKGETISRDAIIKRLEPLRKKFAESADPQRHTAVIDRAVEAFSRHSKDIPVDKAQRIKKNMYQMLKDTSFRGITTPPKETQKAIARGIKEELETVYPALKGLNKKASEYIRLEKSLDKSLGRIQNLNMLGLDTAALSAAGGVAGGVPGMAVTGAAHAVGRIPSVKASLAILLYKQGGKEALKPLLGTPSKGEIGWKALQILEDKKLKPKTKERYLENLFEGEGEAI